jgi:S-DNA-T family DNA segregation ATPase FtsK/SpoIIIE
LQDFIRLCRKKYFQRWYTLPKFFSEMAPEVKYELLGIIMFTVGLLGGISLLGLSTGPVGLFFVSIQKHAFGMGAPLVPLLLVAIGSRYIWTRLEINYSLKFWGFILLYLLFLAIYHHIQIAPGKEIMPESLVPGGGLVGGMILFFLRKLFGVDGTILILVAIAICSVIATTTWSLNRTLVAAKKKAEEGIETAREAVAAGTTEISDFVTRTKESPFLTAAKGRFYDQDKDAVLFKTEPDKPALIDTKADEEDKPCQVNQAGSHQPLIKSEPPAAKADRIANRPSLYKLPPVSLLKKVNKVKPKVSKEISENAALLVETLQSFGVSAKIINTCQGPAVTRYELEPAAGVKVSKIVGLSDDIALKLAATGIRMEAPIPGKAAIGIEVPNKDVTGVHLREVLESEEFLKAKSHLTVALGKDIAGQPIIADLSKMPHMLVAGATGSGKSVCINTLLTSILFKATPEEVKFILVDPKVVELSNYNGIPHLMTPVVTDAKKAAAALNWAVQEMERRYAVFATAGVRDIKRYNETVEGTGLPLILIIIDELADLMMAAPVDVENAICRLAQKARAAGLHLVLATQRPSVDVITGTIKANIPSRISFAVSSQIDSRTVLDMAGAEKLLGKGDMLFYPVGAAKPLRVQGAFISDSEVEELINYIKPQVEPEYTEEITTYAAAPAESGKEQELFEDELLEEAIRMVMETGQASASMLQRKFRIGYSRAGRLIDTMEEMKIVGPNMGSKPREILMSSDQINTLYFKE